jgi:hypothetical protein
VREVPLPTLVPSSEHELGATLWQPATKYAEVPESTPFVQVRV